jgi:hypothetical protein
LTLTGLLVRIIFIFETPPILRSPLPLSIFWNTLIFQKEPVSMVIGRDSACLPFAVQAGGISPQKEVREKGF